MLAQYIPISVWFSLARFVNLGIVPVSFALTLTTAAMLFMMSHWLEFGALVVTYVETLHPAEQFGVPGLRKAKYTIEAIMIAAAMIEIRTRFLDLVLPRFRFGMLPV
jgi:hypothetical protein